MRSIYDRAQKNPLPLIAVEGGPGSGKSGVIDVLRERMPHIHFQKEAASAIFGTGVKVPIRGLHFREFNRSFGKIIRHLETLAEIHALNAGAEAVVFDRALAGLLGYLSSDTQEFELLTGFTMPTVYARYGLVIYLEMPPRDIFEFYQPNNPERYEKTYEEAVATAVRTRNAWRHHTNFMSVPSTIKWEDRVNVVQGGITDFLAQLRSSP